MNRTLPSPINVFTPPGWLLLAVANSESPVSLVEQKAHGYCCELGVKTVLNIVFASVPWSQ